MVLAAYRSQLERHIAGLELTKEQAVDVNFIFNDSLLEGGLTSRATLGGEPNREATESPLFVLSATQAAQTASISKAIVQDIQSLDPKTLEGSFKRWVESALGRKKLNLRVYIVGNSILNLYDDWEWSAIHACVVGNLPGQDSAGMRKKIREALGAEEKEGRLMMQYEFEENVTEVLVEYSSDERMPLVDFKLKELLDKQPVIKETVKVLKKILEKRGIYSKNFLNVYQLLLMVVRSLQDAHADLTGASLNKEDITKQFLHFWRNALLEGTEIALCLEDRVKRPLEAGDCLIYLGRYSDNEFINALASSNFLLTA
eukprot:TRINITY_DN3469_c0_g1_i1.p1 TRINITY_DN3469_c0_g1~~TRINITY_DN3469_c0_g1_i1.p1  ORF type:complete len:315 (+),score=37.83 TRINITY_DN3469_c0_g1_i1:567-1511(+)